MTLRSQITTIHQQMFINKQAFKKNKQSISQLSKHQCVIKSNADLKQIKHLLKDNLKHLNSNKTSSSQAYECIIKQLKLLLKQAWAKNQFLVRDRGEVLMENSRLKQAMECMRIELEEQRKQVCELRLNGYSGGEAAGVYENGNIFNSLQVASHIVSQHSYYNTDAIDYNNEGKQSQQQNHIRPLQNSSGECSSSQQQSMLLRQASQQGLLMSVTSNNININNVDYCNSKQQSEENNNSPSEIMETPNYNFKSTHFLGANNVNNMHMNIIPGHFIDIGSQFISKANSSSASRSGQEQLISRQTSNNKIVEISLNNINNQLYLPIGIRNQFIGEKRGNGLILESEQSQSHQQQQQLSLKNQLYLPIDQNKVTLKQQIQTFKQHLNNFGQQSKENHRTPQQSHIHNNDNDSIYGTKTQECKVTCSSNCQQGIFRAFYMSLLRFPLYREKILCLLQQLQHDQSFTLYKPYPKNSFWVELIIAFLQMINTQKESPQYILQHINQFKLIDTLMIQTLKYRVEYLYNEEIGLGGDGDDEMMIVMDHESELLSGSGNNVDMQQHISNCGDNSNRMIASLYSQQQQQPQSIRASLSSNTAQQIHHTTSQRHLQIFNALANNFDLTFTYSDNRCYQFYSSFSGQQENELIFIVENVQCLQSNNNNFVFDFSLYYQKSQQNTIEKEYMQDVQRRQLDEYQYSVKRQFEDINLNINQRVNTQQRRRNNNKVMNQSSNLLNSGQHFYNQDSGSSNNNKNSNNKNNTIISNFKQAFPHHQRQGSFISQTNQYLEQQQQDYFNQDMQSTLTIPYRQQQQIMSENISYRFNETVETTLDVMTSLRNSDNYLQCYQSQQAIQLYDTSSGQVRGRKQLRQRTYNYTNNQLLLEEEPQTINKTKGLLLKNNSNNPSKQLTHTLSSTSPYHMINSDNKIRNKQNQRYQSGNIYQQNFIIKKVESIQSDYEDSPIQGSSSYYDDGQY